MRKQSKRARQRARLTSAIKQSVLARMAALESDRPAPAVMPVAPVAKLQGLRASEMFALGCAGLGLALLPIAIGLKLLA